MLRRKKKGYTAPRYAAAKSRAPKNRDPALVVLTVQIMICTLLLVVGWGIASKKPSFWENWRAGYRQLLEQEGFAVPGFFDGPSQDGITALQEQAAQAWAAFFSQTAYPDSQASSDTGEGPAEALDGAGGWMGAPPDGIQAPDSCALFPIAVSARVEPPVSGPVTSLYGYRIHPLTGSDDFHRGLDIAAAQGSRIYASLPGTVSEVGESAIYGKYITLDHGDGLKTTYCHCQEIIGTEGERLRQGELVALVGSTGISTGPHVHFELSRDGVYYNPAWVLNGMVGYDLPV